MEDCAGAIGAKRRCMAVGCEALLSELPKYCVQRRLCPEHLKAAALKRRDHGDQLWRFCQQCGKLEPLTAFDGTKRSCRTQLAKRRANTVNRGGPSSSAGGAAGAAASLKPLGAGIRKSSSQGSGLDKLALLSHCQVQAQLQAQLPQALQQQQQLLPQLQPPVQQQQQQHGLLLQQHSQQSLQSLQQHHQPEDLELDVSTRLHTVKQQLRQLETQLALLQEQQQVEAQLAALQQQYEHMHLQRAQSQLIAPTASGLQPFSGPLRRVGTDVCAGSSFLLPGSSNNHTLHPAVTAGVHSTPIPTISAAPTAADVAFIPFMRREQAWDAAAAAAAAAVAPVTAGMSAGLPPIASSSSSRQRSITSLLPFGPGRDSQAVARKPGSAAMCTAADGGGSSSMGNNSTLQSQQQLASQPAGHLHAPAAAADAWADAQSARLLGMHGAAAGTEPHSICRAPVLHIDELLPAGDIPDLEEFLAAGGCFEAPDSGSTHIPSGDAAPASSAAAAPASAGAHMAFGWVAGGQEAAAAAAQYHSLPLMAPASWGGLPAAGGLATSSAQGRTAAGGHKGRSSLDMFSGLLEDVLAEIQAEAAATAQGAYTMHM